MTDERRGHSPTPRGDDDPLDRKIRRLLAVDPSPAFEARVRARVAGEAAPSAWRAGRLWMTFGGATAAAALVLVVALPRPEPPADANTGQTPAIARTGDVVPPPSGAAARLGEVLPGAELPTAAVVPRITTPGPEVTGAPGAGPRGAAGPAVAAHPGPPRFTRVVFSESEREALRQLLAQARNRPVVVPEPAEARAPVAAGEPPAELVIPPISIEPPAGFEIPPVNIEPPAGLEIPPIDIEPLNLALLDTGAVE